MQFFYFLESFITEKQYYNTTERLQTPEEASYQIPTQRQSPRARAQIIAPEEI